MRGSLLFALLLAVLLPATAAAQRLTGAGEVFGVQRLIGYHGGVYEQTGALVGVGGAVRLGRITVALSGLMGTLKGDGSATNPDAKVRSTAVSVLMAAAPNVTVGLRAEGRRFETETVVMTWRLVGGQARYEPNLGMPGLRALADVAVLPMSSVSGGPKLSVAVQGTFGVTFRPGPSGVSLLLGYRFERYDVARTAAAVERYEQFRGLVAAVGLRLGT